MEAAYNAGLHVFPHLLAAMSTVMFFVNYTLFYNFWKVASMAVKFLHHRGVKDSPSPNSETTPPTPTTQCNFFLF